MGSCSFFPFPIMPSVFRRTRKGEVPSSGVAVNQEGLVPVEDLPKARKPYGFQEAVTGPHGLVYAPSGTFSQQGNVSTEPGLLLDGDLHVNLTSFEEAIGLEGESVNADTEDQADKKERQWRKWSEDVIPALLKPYLSLLEQTSGLRDMDKVRGIGDACRGCDKGRLLDVSCIFFQSTSLCL